MNQASTLALAARASLALPLVNGTREGDPLAELVTAESWESWTYPLYELLAKEDAAAGRTGDARTAYNRLAELVTKWRRNGCGREGAALIRSAARRWAARNALDEGLTAYTVTALDAGPLRVGCPVCNAPVEGACTVRRLAEAGDARPDEWVRQQVTEFHRARVATVREMGA